MKKSGFSLNNCLVVIGILALMLIVGSLFDYQLSSALYDSTSFFALVFAGYGQYPVTLSVSACAALLWHKGIVSKVFSVFLEVLAVFLAVVDPLVGIKGMNIIFIVIIALLVTALNTLFFYNLGKNKDRKTINRYVAALLIVTFCSLILVNVIKVFFQRPRMRMIAVTPEASFQNWWVMGCDNYEFLRGLGIEAEEFKSFPSGHSANAAILLIIMGALPLLEEKYYEKRNILFFGALVFVLLVAFSRIVAGAHFLSDVTMGIFVTFVFEIIVLKLIWR